MAKRRKKKQAEIQYGSLIGLIVFATLIFFDLFKTGKMGTFISRIGTLLFGPWHLAVLLTGFFVCFYEVFLKDRWRISPVVFVGLAVLNVGIILNSALISWKGEVIGFKAIYDVLSQSVINIFDYDYLPKAGLVDSLLYWLISVVSSGVEHKVIVLIIYVSAFILIVPATVYEWIMVRARKQKERLSEAIRKSRERQRQKEELRRLHEQEKTIVTEPVEEKPPVTEAMMVEMNNSYTEEELIIQEMANTPKAADPIEVKAEQLKIEPEYDEVDPSTLSAFSRTYFNVDGAPILIRRDISYQDESLIDEVNVPLVKEEITEEKREEAGVEASGEESSEVTVHRFDLNKTRKKKGSYHLPPLSLLDKTSAKSNRKNSETAKEKGERLIEILEKFGITAELTGTYIGPSVTKFEIKPDSSVKVSRIQNISDNIKMELAAKDIRIEAPIPGKNAVGIEIPNAEVMTVRIRELSDKLNEYRNKPLVFALGKNLFGNGEVCDLSKMPHLLIAGATGSGKSVCINTIITSYLLKSDPDEVKLVLVDPKKVEFTPYHDIPHLFWPVITDAKMASQMLGRIVAIMEERYEAFSSAGVRNIQTFNAKIEENNRNAAPGEPLMNKMPYIVVIIDELADLMMVAGKEVEMHIQRITQLARASGIHLIVATQRPSTDVITGIIKSNIPSRISFAVASSIDSRTILDQTGAERLLGHGDMLYFPQGEPSPIRIQGVFESDEEIARITEYVKKEADPAYEDTYFELQRINNASSAASGNSFGVNKKDDQDAMIDEVIEYIRESQKVSTSLLQRKFGFGYNRAARVVDYLESQGLIGPANGSKPREVYLKKEEEE